MAKKDDAEAKHYRELGKRGGELAVLYQKAVSAQRPQAEIDSLATELFNIVTAFALAFLGDRVRASRTALSGVPVSMDDEDLLQDLHIRIFTALQKKNGYKDKGTFKAWALNIAFNVFIDSLNYLKPKKGAVKKKKNEEPEDEDPELPERGKSSAKLPVVSLDVLNDKGYVEKGAGWRADPEGSLVDRELLNLILDGMRAVSVAGIEAWMARAFLGKDEAGVLDLFDINRDTGTTHFRRVTKNILAFVHRHEDFKDMPFQGLREMLLSRPMLEEGDLELIKDARQREALRHAVMPDMTLESLGELMGLSEATARKTLRAAIVALSQAMLRRAEVQAPSGTELELDAWLWAEIDRMLAAYPERPAAVRGPSVSDGELAALCHVAIILVYSREGIEPPKGFGELVGTRIQKDGLDATAKSLDLDRPALLRILSGRVPPEKLTTAVIGRLASHFGMEPRQVASSLRTGASSVPEGLTRGLTPKERERYVEGVRRRVLSRIGKP